MSVCLGKLLYPRFVTRSSYTARVNYLFQVCSALCRAFAGNSFGEK